MPALRLNFVLVIALFFLLHANSKAQLSAKDSSFLNSSIKNVLHFYDQGIGEQAGKFNGSQNIGYPTRVLEKNPYFNSPDFNPGTILYDHVFYDQVNLRYDEVADLVILEDSTHQIELIKERLQAFSIGDNRFRYLIKEDTVSSALSKSGYYQVMVSNKTSLYKKEIKKVREKIINTNELATQIDVDTYYYVQKNNHFFEIQKKKNIFQLFKDKEKEIKRYLKAQHLNYRKDKDYTLTNAVEYYNLLTN